MTTSERNVPDRLDLRPVRPDETVPADLPAPPPDQGLPHWRRSLVAVRDGLVAGVGTLALAPVTETYLVEVHVRPGQRRRGVGTALVEALRHLAEEPYGVCGRVMSSQPWRRPFAESLGATVRMRYPGPWIDPTSPAGMAWALGRRVPSGYSLRPLAEVDEESMAVAWASYVKWVNRPFAVVRIDRIADAWTSYAEGLDPASSTVAVDGEGRLVAFSLVTPDGWLGRTFVVSETVEPDQTDGQALVAAAVAASVRALGARGVRQVELEGHSTDPHSPALAASLPAAVADPMELVELPPRREDERIPA